VVNLVVGGVWETHPSPRLGRGVPTREWGRLPIDTRDGEDHARIHERPRWSRSNPSLGLVPRSVVDITAAVLDWR
jgi:hypothetical protein